MSNRLNRRDMLRSTTLAGVGLWLPGKNATAKGNSPNERLNLAIIGVGGRGGETLKGNFHTENIVALCDVDWRSKVKSYGRPLAGAVSEDYPKAKKYHDFRKMLDELDKQIDAVVVSTPNHTHAAAGVTAMKMGKHCYCEKPLAHSIDEARAMAEVAAKNGLATQMGNQIHAGDNYRRVVELIQSGAIGPVRECHVWRRPVARNRAWDISARPKQTPPVPPLLNWDLWLGPAPVRPYHPCYVPHDFHYWWDFGGGTLGNFGCHLIDLPFWALKLRHPESVEAEGPPVNSESAPDELTVHWEFPARGDLPPVKLSWYHGEGSPRVSEDKKLTEWGAGILFVGEKGMLLANYDNRVLLPKSQFADFQPPEPTIALSVGHQKEWLDACKTGSPTTCNFDYAGSLTETVLLGNVAYRTGRKLEWNPVNLEVTNCPEAQKYIARDYREGWTL